MAHSLLTTLNMLHVKKSLESAAQNDSDVVSESIVSSSDADSDEDELDMGTYSLNCDQAYTEVCQV